MLVAVEKLNVQSQEFMQLTHLLGAVEVNCIKRQ